MASNPANAPTVNTAWTALEPYAQLLRSLMPRAESIWVFDAAAQLRWTSESMTGPDLYSAIESGQKRALEDPSLPGEVVQLDRQSSPLYQWWLRTDAGALIATVAVSVRRSGDGEPQLFSLINSLARPAIECLRRELSSQSHLLGLTQIIAAREKDMDLVLSVSDSTSHDAGAHVDELKLMLQRAADHMHCMLTALIVPEKSIALIRAGADRTPDGSLLARTHRQLLQMTQSRRDALIINKVMSGPENATQLPYRILCCPVKHPSGRTMGALALFRDAEAPEFEARDARLAELLARKASANIEASYDALSGLLTRPALEQRLLALGSEPSAPRMQSALYIDVDQLHAINENFGMHEGDNMLSQIGELIRRRLPSGGLAARISGDRFALLLTQRREQAAEFAESLRQSAAQLGSTHANTRLHVSISVGVAALEKGSEGLAHALAAAESACKAAKDRGRNRVDVYEDADVSIIRRFTDITTAGELREAIASNRFRLDAQIIQPVGAAAHTHPTHFELLLRMIGLDGETVGPDRFLSAAQRYQLMPAIDRWVLTQAISMLRPHAALLANRAVVFSLNFSGQSLNDDDFPDFLLGAVETSGIEPSAFCFELTESDAVQNIAKAEMLMRRLRRIGCGVALDDFGTGLSSLAYLRSLPATILKIDGSFVRDILKDPRSDSMVQAIAQLARNIGIATVAEYAETPELLTRVTALGVDFAQGFAIGKPSPLADLLPELPLYAALTPLMVDSLAETGRNPLIAVGQ
jgi:diguanylate cyclase (GGDEF)-like protein